jgi:hypothetical protein
MRKQISIWMTACSLLVVVAASTHAQTSGNQFRGYIPFQFVAGEKTFPAGKYVIERINRETPQETILIREADGQRGVLVLTSPVDNKGRQVQPRLVFHTYGETRFLVQLQTSGSDMGLQLPHSRAERALERELQRRTARRSGGEVALPRYQSVVVILGQEVKTPGQP